MHIKDMKPDYEIEADTYTFQRHGETVTLVQENERWQIRGKDINASTPELENALQITDNYLQLRGEEQSDS